MPVQIGQNLPSFSNPTALLSDCHRRIEMFLGMLEATGKVLDQPATEETARALTVALRYFREAAPKHNADEEDSLFPRLRQSHNPELQCALARLDELENEHQWAAPLHRELDRLGAHYTSQGQLVQADAEHFRDIVSKLIAMYRKHIQVEDEEVFPIAARVLSKPEQASIAKEMAARRNAPIMTEMGNS